MRLTAVYSCNVGVNFAVRVIGSVYARLKWISSSQPTLLIGSMETKTVPITSVKTRKRLSTFFAQADREKNKNAIKAYNARKKKNRSLESWNSFLIPALVILRPFNPSGTRIVISSASLCRLMVEVWIRFGFWSVYSTISSVPNTL